MGSVLPQLDALEIHEQFEGVKQDGKILFESSFLLGPESHRWEGMPHPPTSQGTRIPFPLKKGEVGKPESWSASLIEIPDGT
jgi:hypothetical protein